MIPVTSGAQSLVIPALPCQVRLIAIESTVVVIKVPLLRDCENQTQDSRGCVFLAFRPHDGPSLRYD